MVQIMKNRRASKTQDAVTPDESSSKSQEILDDTETLLAEIDDCLNCVTEVDPEADLNEAKVDYLKTVWNYGYDQHGSSWARQELLWQARWPQFSVCCGVVTKNDE